MIKRIVSGLIKKKSINKLFLKCSNKLKIYDNDLSASSVRFRQNSILIIGSNNRFSFQNESFMNNSKIYLNGQNNIIDIKDKVEIISEKNLVFNITGNNNLITVDKYSTVRNTTFFIHGDNNKISIGKHTSIYGTEFHIEQNNNEINVGDDTTFHGRNGYPVHLAVDEASKIIIKEDCMFANGIQIRSTDSHSIIDGTGKRINYAEDIVIESHVWVCLGAIILKGAHVSKNTVVGAGTVCTKKFSEENVLIAGNPCSIVKRKINWQREFL